MATSDAQDVYILDKTLAINGLSPYVPLSNKPYVMRSMVDLRFSQIRNCLLTRPGENVSDKTYGVGMQHLVFENENDGVSIDATLGRIKPQLNKIQNVTVGDVKFVDKQNVLGPGVFSVVIQFAIDLTSFVTSKYTILVQYDNSGFIDKMTLLTDPNPSWR